MIFAFHGYPQLIHRLIDRRPNHRNFHVHGYREEGTITTPFDMVVLNSLDCFHLARAAVTRLPNREKATAFGRAMDEYLQEHHSILHQMKRPFRAVKPDRGRVIRHPEQPDIPAHRRYVWLFIWRLGERRER